MSVAKQSLPPRCLKKGCENLIVHVIQKLPQPGIRTTTNILFWLQQILMIESINLTHCQDCKLTYSLGYVMWIENIWSGKVCAASFSSANSSFYSFSSYLTGWGTVMWSSVAQIWNLPLHSHICCHSSSNSCYRNPSYLLQILSKDSTHSLSKE